MGLSLAFHIVFAAAGVALPPELTLSAASAPPRTRALLLIVLACGVPVLAPSLAILYRVFKRAPPSPHPPDDL